MFLLKIFIFFANVIYLFFKIFKVQNKKICFLSRQSDEVPLEFQLIIDELLKSDYKIVTICKKLNFNFKSLIENFFLIFKQMYEIATSKIVIIDGYSVPISVLKHKKSLIVIQMWHANAIIKKIGLQTLNNASDFKRKLSLTMKMHKNYTYVFSSSEKTSKVYKEAFDHNAKIIETGTPILDYLYYGKHKEKRNEIISRYNINNKKKNIVYMPTYRKNKEIFIKDIVKIIDRSKYNLIFKFHPVTNEKTINKKCIYINDYPGEEVLSIADYVISDYSNIAFESVLIGIPTFFYVYDIDEYKEYPGLNIDLFKEIPEYTSKDINELIIKIEKNDFSMNKMKNVANKYIDTFDGKCVKRIIEFISSAMK